MTVLLVRHATAGRRQEGAEDDHLRPLDEQGRREAEGLVELLVPFGVERVLTSPYIRCRQTVEPLAAALGLPVEDRRELAEGASAGEALGLVSEVDDAVAVICTHGDVVQELLGEESPKGSTWVLDLDADGGLNRREYLPPT
jgi:phosphohistidine phosphatase SixA